MYDKLILPILISLKLLWCVQLFSPSIENNLNFCTCLILDTCWTHKIRTKSTLKVIFFCTNTIYYLHTYRYFDLIFTLHDNKIANNSVCIIILSTYVNYARTCILNYLNWLYFTSELGDSPQTVKIIQVIKQSKHGCLFFSFLVNA